MIPKEIVDLYTSLDNVDNEHDSSLAIHRFASKNGYIPPNAIENHFNRFRRLLVWANELVRATGKPKSKMWWFFSRKNPEALGSRMRFSINNCEECDFTPGQLGDGTVVYSAVNQNVQVILPELGPEARELLGLLMRGRRRVD